MKIILKISAFFILVFSVNLATAQEKLKVFISVDMEGIVGVVNSDQVSSTGRDYGRFRRIMTESANAAVRGAVDAGATEIIVNDSHGNMRNLMIENLHPAAQLLSGSPKKLSMMEGIDDSFDAVIFVGYHASMGTPNGILDHTMSSRNLANLWINGKLMNEASMNAAIAGYYGVPVVFIAGDKALTDEATKIIGTGFEILAVKKGVGRQAALNLSMTDAHKKMQQLVAKGINNRKNIKLYNLGSHYDFEMEFLISKPGDTLQIVPGVTRISGRSIKFSGDDFIKTYMFMRTLLALAGT